jgi:hypothetical protein
MIAAALNLSMTLHSNLGDYAITVEIGTGSFAEWAQTFRKIRNRAHCILKSPLWVDAVDKVCD